MMFHRILLILLLTLITNTTAYANVCKLNIRGDNICLDDNVLHKITIQKERPQKGIKNREERTFYKVVRVLSMEYPLVLIEEEGNNITVSIDDLIQSQDCRAGDFVCEKDKVTLAPDCAPANKEKYKVEAVFKNEMISVKAGFMFVNRKSHVLPIDCVDAII